jgi:hypothetical protein
MTPRHSSFTRVLSKLESHHALDPERKSWRHLVRPSA